MDSSVVHFRSQSMYHQAATPSSDTSSPILVIAIVGIIITAILLLSYYVFVIKCWLSLHRIGLLRRFSTSRTRRYEDPFIAYDPTLESRGVDESIIRAIPIFQFKKGGDKESEEKSLYECAVCLNEFQDDEKLRVLPSCSHAFHIDCIDIWLQSNANCPLCRSSICARTRIPADQIIAPSTSPQDQSSVIHTPIGGDEDYVVVEVSDDSSEEQILPRRRELAISCELLARPIQPSPRKLVPKKARKFHHVSVSSMGDECIDIRCKDDQFSVQPIRRSFSMDSSTNQQLYLAVQEIIQQDRHLNEVNTSEGCSSRVRKSIFSFSNGRGSRNAVIPVRDYS